MQWFGIPSVCVRIFTIRPSYLHVTHSLRLNMQTPFESIVPNVGHLPWFTPNSHLTVTAGKSINATPFLRSVHVF